MGHWVLGETLPDPVHKPRFFVEYNRASGDGAAKDGRHGTFDALFPSSHDKYGLTDLFCSSNVVHFRAGFQYTPRKGITLAAAYDDFWLASAHDALYVLNKIAVTVPKWAVGNHVGREADIQAQWTVSRSTLFTVGYGRLFAGEFLKGTTSGVPYNLLTLNLAQKF